MIWLEWDDMGDDMAGVGCMGPYIPPQWDDMNWVGCMGPYIPPQWYVMNGVGCMGPYIPPHSYHPPYHPSPAISSLISSHPIHIIPHIIPQILHKNVKIVVLSSKSTVPAGDLDLDKQSRGTWVDMA